MRDANKFYLHVVEKKSTSHVSKLGVDIHPDFPVDEKSQTCYNLNKY